MRHIVVVERTMIQTMAFQVEANDKEDASKQVDALLKAHADGLPYDDIWEDKEITKEPEIVSIIT